MKIWLDDERDPQDKFIQENNGATGEEIWCKTAQDAIQLLKTGNVTYISFDHDLGMPDNGYTVAEWIEEAAYNNIIPRLQWRIHSYNPIGRSKIYAAMKQAEKYW